MDKFYQKFVDEGEEKKAESLLKVVLNSRIEEVRAVEVPESWQIWG